MKQLLNEHSTKIKGVFKGKEHELLLLVLSDLIFVLFLVPPADHPECCYQCCCFAWANVWRERSLFITLLPLPPTQKHYGTVRPSIKDTTLGAVSPEMQTGKWSIGEIVRCIWVSDNCRLPDNLTEVTRRRPAGSRVQDPSGLDIKRQWVWIVLE